MDRFNIMLFTMLTFCSVLISGCGSTDSNTQSDTILTETMSATETIEPTTSSTESFIEPDETIQATEQSEETEQDIEWVDYSLNHKPLNTETFYESSYSTLHFDKNWDEFVYLDDTVISSSEFTEFCSLKNYFFDQKHLGETDTIFLPHYDHMYDYPFIATFSNDEQDYTGSLNVICGSYDLNSMIQKLHADCIPSSISYDLTDTFPDIDNKQVSLGVDYAHVIALLGRPDYEMEAVFSSGNAVEKIWETEKATLSITFLSPTPESDDTNKYVAVSIDWVPTTLNTLIINKNYQ